MKRNQKKWTFFAQEKKSPFQLVRWKSFESQLKNSQGEVIFHQKKIQAPESWSQLAVDIAASKYFRRASGKFKGETSIEQLITRVTSTIARAGLKQKVFQNKPEAHNFERELQHILIHQMAAFNSPVWFNCGLFEKYKLKSPAENFAYDFRTKKIKAGTDGFERPQSSACFIQSVDDSLLGIFDLIKQEAKLFKYGSGSGSNFSAIRGRNEKISSGGTSSGLMSFLDVFDKAAGVIKSGGTTRRAAKMVVIDVDHPEIEDFINWKVEEERKVQALVNAGYSDDFEGEAYRSVSGQNSNNSVRVTNAFMNAVENNEIWKLRNRSDQKVYKEIPARKLWEQIVSAAWTVADPGVHFSDHIQAWHTCPESGEIRSSNPCSEFVFLDDTACNLASINLVRFLKQDGQFDFDAFRHTIRILITAQEILVDHSSYPTFKLAQNSHDYRPLGLGFANLGALIMSLGLPYDSQEARTLASVLTSIMTGESYLRSSELASQLGAFQGFRKNKKSFLKVIEKHSKAAYQLAQLIRNLQSSGSETLAQYLENLWAQVQVHGKDDGFRNAQVTVIAPTGTIAFMMDCDTTGIEPEFSLVKIKKLAGGGTLQLVNRTVATALQQLGYSQALIDQVQKSLLQGSSEWQKLLQPKDLAVFDCALSASGHDRQISVDGHLKMMAAVQPFISGAISKTVNLPASSTRQDVSEVYWKAWKLGLKAVAIYRDQSKLSQPLNKKTEDEKPILDSQTKRWKPVESLEATMSPPKCPQCQTQTVLQSGCFICPNCGTSLSCS